MSEIKENVDNLNKIKNKEMKEKMKEEMKEETKKKKKTKNDDESKEGYTDNFDKYLKTSNILSEMQQLLISHIGLSMGILSTILFVSNSKTFISSYLKYIIYSLMAYSFMLFITGYGEYIEKFIQLNKHGKFKDVTSWDYGLSIIYFIVGIIMLLVISLLYISLVREKLA